MAPAKHREIIDLFLGELMTAFLGAIYADFDTRPAPTNRVREYMRALLRDRGSRAANNVALGYVLRRFTILGWLHVDRNKRRITLTAKASKHLDAATKTSPPLTPAPLAPPASTVPLRPITRNVFRHRARCQAFLATFVAESGTGYMEYDAAFACMRRFASQYLVADPKTTSIRNYLYKFCTRKELILTAAQGVKYFATPEGAKRIPQTDPAPTPAAPVLAPSPSLDPAQELARAIDALPDKLAQALHDAFRGVALSGEFHLTLALPSEQRPAVRRAPHVARIA